jgi:hypothetical protein
MKVVTAYIAGALREETLEALGEFWGLRKLDLHILDAKDQFAYGQIIQGYWERGETFMVVEPDIVIRKDVVDAFLHCECEYGCFPYPWLTDVGPALGCTWFRSSFLKKYPEAMREVNETRVMWNQIDVVLMRHVLARKHGEQPHVHLPPVEHLNPDKQLMAEASDIPLMSVPHW